MYKPSTVVPPNNILEITPPKDLEYPITFYPTVDTFFDKDNNNLVTLMELPGFPISDIEINIGDGEMIVSGITLRPLSLLITWLYSLCISLTLFN